MVLMVKDFKKDLDVEQRMPGMKPIDFVKISTTRTEKEMYTTKKNLAQAQPKKDADEKGTFPRNTRAARAAEMAEETKKGWMQPRRQLDRQEADPRQLLKQQRQGPDRGRDPRRGGRKLRSSRLGGLKEKQRRMASTSSTASLPKMRTKKNWTLGNKKKGGRILRAADGNETKKGKLRCGPSKGCKKRGRKSNGKT